MATRASTAANTLTARPRPANFHTQAFVDTQAKNVTIHVARLARLQSKVHDDHGGSDDTLERPSKNAEENAGRSTLTP
jgi:hypothetical protein